jgi:hypothetical protein
MAGMVELTGLEHRRLRMWRSDAFDGILFSRGKGMTHPYPRHWHEELHLCAYTSGAGYLGYGGNSHLVTEGDFVATPPGEVHENWVDGEAGISFLGMYVDAGAFARTSRQIAGCELRIPGLRDFFVRDTTARESFLELHQAAERRESQLEQDDLLLKFLHVFLSRCAAEVAAEPAMGCERAAVRRARDYIEENFDGSISLAQLGKLTELPVLSASRVL